MKHKEFSDKLAALIFEARTTEMDDQSVVFLLDAAKFSIIKTARR